MSGSCLFMLFLANEKGMILLLHYLFCVMSDQAHRIGIDISKEEKGLKIELHGMYSCFQFSILCTLRPFSFFFSSLFIHVQCKRFFYFFQHIYIYLYKVFGQ